MDPHKINEAEKEAALLEELDHPNILRCVDFFFTPAPAAVSLVLEYCEKGTMSSFLKQSGQLSTVVRIPRFIEHFLIIFLACT